jgi:Amt family ammonium transporter
LVGFTLYVNGFTVDWVGFTLNLGDFRYGFAYGSADGGNAFIGNDLFALDGFNDWSGFIFQWAFAAATATIVSGSVAERCTFQGYICYSTYLTGFVYPVVVHWIWAEDGA